MKFLSMEENVLDKEITLKASVRELAYIFGCIGNVGIDEIQDDIWTEFGFKLDWDDCNDTEKSLVKEILVELKRHLCD